MPGGTLDFTAVPIGALGNGIIVTVANVTGTPNLPLSVAVVGTTITITPQTDGGGVIISLCTDVANLMNSTPAVAALVTTFAVPPPGGTVQVGSTTLSGGGNPSVAPSANVKLYDYSHQAIQSQFGLDLFFNAIGRYGNGALVPPLLYPVESQIQIDVQNLLPVPISMEVFFIGRQRFPC